MGQPMVEVETDWFVNSKRLKFLSGNQRITVVNERNSFVSICATCVLACSSNTLTHTFIHYSVSDLSIGILPALKTIISCFFKGENHVCGRTASPFLPSLIVLVAGSYICCGLLANSLAF